MPQAAAVLAVAGTVISVVGAIKEGNAARKQANAQAKFLSAQAANVKAKSRLDANDLKRQISRRASSIRAAEGAAGLQIGTGSSLLAAEDFATQGDIRVNRVKLGGDLQANSLQHQAHFTETAGRNTQQAARFRAGASLLKGASSFGGGFGGGATGGNGVNTLTASQRGNLNAVSFQP